MSLVFSNHRRPILAGPHTWSDSDRKQIEAICTACGFEETLADYCALAWSGPTPRQPGDLEDLEWELTVDELVDVADETGTIHYQIHFFDFGTAYMFRAGTAEEIGGACQHHFELSAPDADLLAAIAQAYASSVPKLEQTMSFPSQAVTPTPRESPRRPAPRPPAPGSLGLDDLFRVAAGTGGRMELGTPKTDS